jgi:alpha/beta superfamily hydrolase
MYRPFPYVSFLQPLVNDSRPLLFIMGTRDTFTPFLSGYSRWLGHCQNASSVILEGEGHFWVGSEHKLVSEIDKLLRSIT